MPPLSPLRARLASFEHAYAVAFRQRSTTPHQLFVVHTGDPFQPYRVTTCPPADGERLLVQVA